MFLRSEDGHRLATRAAKEAETLGLNSMGPDHLLLALIHPEDDTPASRALRNSGGDYDKLLATVTVRSPGASTLSGDKRWITVDPASREVMGRAEGLAAGLGATRICSDTCSSLCFGAVIATSRFSSSMSTADRVTEPEELLPAGPKSRSDLPATLKASPARVQQLLAQLGNAVSAQQDPELRRGKPGPSRASADGASAHKPAAKSAS